MFEDSVYYAGFGVTRATHGKAAVCIPAAPPDRNLRGREVSAPLIQVWD
jgi:hypothetical protein